MSLSLTVKADKHENAVSKDDPSAVREIGFKVTATLTATGGHTSASTLQEKYRLEQWVTDKYWLQTRASASASVWTNHDWEKTDWKRDEFGKDKGGVEFR